MQVRHKSPFIRHIDSSEDCPSPHDSIYEAYHITNSDESSNQIEQSIPMVHLFTTDTQPANNENLQSPPDAEFRYGRGTVLDTITEKNSTGTIRSLAYPRSADNVHNIPFLAHRDSYVVTKRPRRKQAFSMDDIQLIKKSYHEVCHEIYASPKVSLLSTNH